MRENFFLSCLFSILVFFSLINCTSENTNYYYASIILDKSDQVKDVSCYFENGTSILLKNNYDYVILEHEDWKILTLRVPYSSRELIVRK